MSKRVRLTIVVDDERIIEDDEDIDEVKDRMIEDITYYLRDYVVSNPYRVAEWDITEEVKEKCED